MAFGVCRVRNLSASDIGGTETHNARKYEELGLKTPENINPERSVDNSHWVAGDQFDEGLNVQQAIDKRLKELGIKPRSNSVVAIEYVLALTGNPKEKFDMWRNYSASGFLSAAQQWVAKKHGGTNNLISISQHFDESNPHVHVLVLPVVEKTVKWKNKNGAGERTENRLCARDFTGHPDKLSQLQTDFHQFIESYGPKMGVKFYRGTKKEESHKEYTHKTSHELGKMRKEIDDALIAVGMLKDDIKIQEAKLKAEQMELDLRAKKADFEKNQAEMGKIIEHHKKEQGKDEKWKKNLGRGMGY